MSTDLLFRKVMSCQLLDNSTEEDVWIVYFNFPDGFVPISVFSQVLTMCIKRNATRSEQLMW